MAQYDINLREYWRIIKKRKMFIILITIILTLFSIALATIRAPSPLYEATSSIKFEKSVSPLGLYTKIFSWGSGSEIETQMAVIRGYPAFKKVALAMGLVDSEEKDLDAKLSQTITNLRSKVRVSREGYSNIVNITARASSPEFAANLANQTALAYKETHAHEISQRTAEAIKFIKGQLEEVGGQLRKSEEELRRFRENKSIIALTSQSSSLLSRADSVETRLAATMEARKELEVVMKKMKEASGNPLSSRQAFSSEKASAIYQKLNSRLIDLMIEIDTLLVQYTSSHPEVIETDKQIIEIKQKMITELESQLKIEAEKEKELRKKGEILKQKIQSLPSEGLQLARLERDIERFSQTYSLLESKYQEALIQDAEKPEEVTIVRPAFEPSGPINPPKTASSALLGTMIGVVLGLVFAFVVETFDTSLGAIEDVEVTLGLQVLGLIPYIDEKDIQESLKDEYKQDIAGDTMIREARLIPNFGPQSVLAESFRSLRTSIQFSALEKNIKAIVLTSTITQEGKTAVAANLAIAMAQGGLRTLLVDTDLRKPSIHRIFGLDASPGITEHLLSNYDFSDAIRTVTDIMMGNMSMDKIMLTPGIDNLHIITCGTVPLNPAELIQSEKFKGFIDDIHDQYDVILLDTPPLISAADASILAMNTDGVLLVYRAGMVARNILKRAKSQLEQAKANIIGVVLNGVKAEISLDYDKYHQYYYYGQEGTKKKIKQKKKREKGRRKFPRLFLLVIPLLFLIIGLLWQSGIINFDRYFGGRKPSLKEDKIPSLEVRPIEPKKTDRPENTITPIPHPASTNNYPYSIMTGSFKTIQRAEGSVFSLKEKGLAPYWTLVNLGEKGKWFRVCVGHFETLEAAKELKESAGLRAGKIVETAYANEIGYFTSEDEVREKVISLQESGYSSYIVEDPQKGYRLLIGAYVTKEGADEMARTLKEAGIDSRVLLR